MIQALDSNFYGTTPTGGANGSGTIFRTNSAGTLETLYSFVPPYHPEAGLIQATDGLFYGSAVAAPNGSSVYYKIDTSGTLTTLHVSIDSEGSYPSGSLIQASDGSFYGTAQNGGANGYGVVLKLDTTGTLTVLHSFNSTDGAHPMAGVILAADGSFYGTTSAGGINGIGTIFKIDSSGNLTTLHSFAGADGANPAAGLVQGTDGAFYGDTPAGGANGLGTLFRMDAVGNLSTLHSFAGSDGQEPLGQLLEASDGNFYGTTSVGGRNGDGTIFRLDNTNNLTTIHDFVWTDGATPTAGLIQASDGSLYGTTQGGGLASGGVVFVTDLAGSASVLVRFSPRPTGEYPYAGVVQVADGTLYGTTSAGGANSLGSIFRMNDRGQVVTIHSFTGADGAQPRAPLIQGTDGNLYGTTSAGGLANCGSGCGTIFRIDLSGNMTVLHYFKGVQYHDGLDPLAPLLQANDGLFYGTTALGGDHEAGTVFSMDASGNVTILHHFTGGVDGGSPRAAVTQAANGSFYGTTYFGGASLNCEPYGCGTVFTIDSSGIFSTVHNFTGGTEGWWPHASVVATPDGTLYGTLQYGGANNAGRVYKIPPIGNIASVHDFNGNDGEFPTAGVILGSDGALYGTTNYGSNIKGTLFRVDTTGSFTTYHNFLGPDGSLPDGTLLQGLDGGLYGTTTFGGSGDQGTVYRLYISDLMNVTGESVQCGQDGLNTYTTAAGEFSNYLITATMHGSPATVVSQSPTSVTLTTPTGNPGQVSDLTLTEHNIYNSTATLTRAFLYDFLDVPWWNAFRGFVCSVVRNGLSAGCGAGNFCPTDSVLRSQMAVFLLQGEHGSVYLASSADCATYPFADVPCPSVFANYILQLYDEGITGGCATNPLRFCPNDPVPRVDMAVFLLLAEHGTGYMPPTCTGIFADVPCPGPFTDWIEALYTEGITGGCSTNPLQFCPGNPVTRAQMAVFLTTTFTLQ